MFSVSFSHNHRRGNNVIGYEIDKLIYGLSCRLAESVDLVPNEPSVVKQTMMKSFLLLITALAAQALPISNIIIDNTTIYYINSTSPLLGSHYHSRHGSSSQGGGDGGGCSGTTFDYLLLVQQWPAAATNTQWPKEADLTDFTLHGLWPSRIGSAVSSYPCQCTDEEFSEDKIQGSLDEMKSHWPSYNGDDDAFWTHEWSKHGTCAVNAGSVSDQSDFFATAISLRSKSGLLSAFEAAGIKADGSTYAHDDMVAAVKKSLGAEPTLGCNKQNELSEIGICYSKTDLSAQGCDASVVNQKSDEISDCDHTQPITFLAPQN